MNATERNPFFAKLSQAIDDLGGQFNAHLHLDRAGTFEDKYFPVEDFELSKTNHISLHRKHALIERVHSGPAYDADDLEARIRNVLETFVELGTRRADTMVDVTPDRVGLDALTCMQRLAREYGDKLELKAAAYTPLGFNDKQPERWEIFREGARQADFIGALPEADDQHDYPENIGFDEHCRRILEVALEEKKMVHFHTDQRNDSRESGTEQVIAAVKRYGAPQFENGEPSIWMIHMVSPSTYEEERFQRLAENLAEENIGVICCPSAAVGMRQLRALPSPTYNSIPRVLELLAAGVKVRIASDNIADICSPSTTADLLDELLVLSAAIRFYHLDVLAHLGAGKFLPSHLRELLQEHLRANEQEIAKVITKYNA